MQQVSIETLANLLNCQQISIDIHANLLDWEIGIDRYPCKPITLSNRYRSISSRTYRFNQYVLIGGDKRHCSNDSLLGVNFELCWGPRHLSIYTFASISVAQQAIVATAPTLLFPTIPTYRQTPKPSDCAPRQVSILIIADLLLAQQPIRQGMIQGMRRS